jgi:hypothetical protein
MFRQLTGALLASFLCVAPAFAIKPSPPGFRAEEIKTNGTTLHALAPTGSEAPFAVAQAVVLLAFIAIGVTAAPRFRPIVA